MPEGWCWCRLRNIGDYKKGPFGSALTKSIFVPKTENTIKVYEQKNAIQHNHLLGNYYISKEYFEKEMQSFEVLPGDIIVSCAGTIGETYILPNNIEKGIINQALMRMRLTSLLHISYFLIYFEYILKEEAAKSGKGTAIKNIPPFDVFKNFLLPLPPIAEQKLIVEEIEKIFAQIDLLEQNKTDLQTAIKQAKSKILDLAIHGKLVLQDPNDEPASVLLEKIRAEKEEKIAKGELKRDKNDSYIYKSTTDNCHYEKLNGKDVCIEDELPFTIPDSWQWCRLGEIGTWQSGTTPNRKNIDFYLNGTIPWLLTGDLNDGYITNIPNKITEFAYVSTSLKLNPIDSICIAMYGATIGKLGILTFPATTNQACCVCSNYNGVEKLFLFYFLMNHKEHFIQQGFGGAQPNISKEKIIETFLPLPPLSEQKRIVAKIEELFSLLDQIQTNLV